MRRFHQLRGQKGVTLPELMIVLAIAAILTAVSIPMWISYMPTMRLNGAARNLQLALALARMKGVARNNPVSLLLDTAQQTYKLQIWNKTTLVWEDETGPDKLMSPSDLKAQGITITFAETFPDGGKRIIFGNRGTCRTSPTASGTVGGDITLKNNQGKTRTITITASTGIATLN